MKFFLLLSKRNLIIITSLAVIILLIWGGVCSAAANRVDGSTNAQRMAYIKRLGYSVDDSAASCKNITVPGEFSDVYSQYNKLQKEAGFDLSRYKGRKAQVFTYPFSYNSDMELHLIVCDGVIIGGDTASVKLGGEMKPLVSN